MYMQQSIILYITIQYYTILYNCMTIYTGGVLSLKAHKIKLDLTGNIGATGVACRLSASLGLQALAVSRRANLYRTRCHRRLDWRGIPSLEPDLCHSVPDAELHAFAFVVPGATSQSLWTELSDAKSPPLDIS